MRAGRGHGDLDTADQGGDAGTYLGEISGLAGDLGLSGWFEAAKDGGKARELRIVAAPLALADDLIDGCRIECPAEDRLPLVALLAQTEVEEPVLRWARRSLQGGHCCLAVFGTHCVQGLDRRR